MVQYLGGYTLAIGATMKRLLSRVNIPTAVAVLLIVMVDRQFDLSGKALRAIKLTPSR